MNATTGDIGVASFAVKPRKEMPSGGKLLAGSFLKRREAEEQRESILKGFLCSSFPLRFKKESANHTNRRPAPFFVWLRCRRNCFTQSSQLTDSKSNAYCHSRFNASVGLQCE